jgi:hypothetical protein
MTTQRFGIVLFSALGLLSFGLGGCSAATSGPAERESPGEDSDAIVGGSPATAYQEAVLVNMKQGGQITAACSGSLIAPNVVLTAGHCVHGFDGWEIVAPFAGNQKADSSKGVTKDWKNDTESVDPNQHDVGLIVLSSKIDLAGGFPSVASKPVAFGSKVVNIGRIDNGDFSDSQLFVSEPHAVTDGANDGYPFDYSADEIIQSGDSGGPVQVPGAKPHAIVAVNSGAGGGSEVLARVDLVFDWIQSTVQSAGGDVTPNDPSNDPADPNADPADPNADPNDPGVDPNDPNADPGNPSDPAAGDECGQIGYEGMCTEKGSVLWCEDGKLVGTDCPAQGSWCVYEPWNEYYDCL